jgi:peptidoglycan hydrolase-like protein with peptidoglycan-binding domain
MNRRGIGIALGGSVLALAPAVAPMITGDPQPAAAAEPVAAPRRAAAPASAAAAPAKTPAPQALTPTRNSAIDKLVANATRLVAPQEQPTPLAEIPIAPLASVVEKVPQTDQPIPAIGSKTNGTTKVVQVRLAQLGFWNSFSGHYDWSTQQAVLAFQKYMGLRRTGSVDAETANWLSIFTERARGESNYGTLVEIDKDRQLLFLVKDGRTVWVFNTSTGSGKAYKATNKKDPTKTEEGDAVTPVGLFRTDRQRPDGWWEGDLGKIYRPKYFVGGIAIHGMTSVPAYPASHGCVRLSLPAMDFLWAQDLVPLGTPVWVHD